MSARHNRPEPCENCVRIWAWSGFKCRRFHGAWEHRLDRDYWAGHAGTFSVPVWCLPASKLRRRRRGAVRW